MHRKEMVNTLSRNNVARLTFGNLDSGISSSDPSSEVSIAFTPSTLALLERTFVDLGESLGMPKQMESNPDNPWDQSTSYSGTSDCSNDSDDTSFSGEWTTTGGKRRKLYDDRVSTADPAGDVRPARRLPGPRPSCKDEEMTVGDLERRKRRRERNKHAASKCRQRRVDQTNELLEETKSLEEESQRLQKEIETLERLTHQLEFVLEAHMPLCNASTIVISQPKVEPCNRVSSSNRAPRPSSLPIETAPSISTSAGQMFFDFSLTGLTPSVDPFVMFGSMDGASPSAFLLSPSSFLSQ